MESSLLKQPPDTAHLIRGVEGMALSGGYQQCQVPYHTIGIWTTRIARLPASRGWHALVFTRLAEFSFERDDFLLLAQDQADAPGLHHRFLDRRSPLPLHRSWRDWLWRRGLRTLNFLSKNFAVHITTKPLRRRKHPKARVVGGQPNLVILVNENGNRLTVSGLQAIGPSHVKNRDQFTRIIRHDFVGPDAGREPIVRDEPIDSG